MKRKTLYRIFFTNQEKNYEIYARHVAQRELFGFITIEDLVFGENSSLVVDPGQERLKNEFQGVTSFHIPMHAVLRIDQVEQEGIAKVTQVVKEGNISPFPTHIYTKPPTATD